MVESWSVDMKIKDWKIWSKDDNIHAGIGDSQYK